MTGDVRERTLHILRETTEREEVLSHPDLPLFSSGVLDSLGTVSLMVALSEEFDVTISPAEFDRGAWATPSKLVADVARRVAVQQYQRV